MSRGLMIVGWANVGTAVLVFLAAIDVQLAVLYVVGLTGLAVAFDVAPRFKPGLSALFCRIGDLVEAADTVLCTAIECWKTRADDDLATFSAMTEDRGTMMEGIRRTYAEGDAGVDHKDRAGLFHLTSLFERIIWLLRQVGLSLRERGPAQAER